LNLNSNFKLKSPDIKIRTSKSKVTVKCNIKSARKASAQIEKFINSFYEQLFSSTNAEKVIGFFKTEGKGAVIEVEGNPIFPLKVTLDYIINNIKGLKTNISCINIESDDAHHNFKDREAFKEAQNNNQLSNMNINDVQQCMTALKFQNQVEYTPTFRVTVEGFVLDNNEKTSNFRHIF